MEEVEPSFEIVVEEISHAKMNGHISVLPEERKPPAVPVRSLAPKLPLTSPQPMYSSIPPPPPPPPPRMALSSSLSFYPVFPTKKLFTIDEERTYI